MTIESEMQVPSMPHVLKTLTDIVQGSLSIIYSFIVREIVAQWRAAQSLWEISNIQEECE
jgi:hypothetical protein